ncbi:5-methylcytosine-specific restriction endonuclease system specificity protein McrC [Photobacterium sanguinicancri]|uniref:5-methylcytosine-specific restriction endonuclease system specificity protein McrC n=1 Tax=Photobacterium sanguinicancri TaxID=875932 RepID=UPI003D0D8531
MRSTAINPRGYVGKIPVRNLWLLMLYASECRFLVSQLADDEEAPDNVANLVAEVFCDLVEHRLKRNLSTEFVSTEREINRVRGRIKVLETERSMSLSKGKVVCAFDELTMDSVRNRYIRSALARLVKIVGKADLSSRCQNLSHRLQSLGVSSAMSVSYKPSRDRFGRHESDDRQVLLMAELVHDMHLLNESVGNKLLPSPDKQKEWVRKLFEKAVGGLYKLKLSPLGWKVQTGKKLSWQIDEGTLQGKELLPSMKLDILLEHNASQQRVIIDTKFTDILTRGQFGNVTFKSHYIYQLYSYLLSQESVHDQFSKSATGMLLHPAIGQSFDESVNIQGHEIRFCTVDLSVDSESIVRRLLQLILRDSSFLKVNFNEN